MVCYVEGSGFRPCVAIYGFFSPSVLTLSPIAAIIWAFFLFGTMPSLQQLMGGVGVILGVSIVTLKQNI